MNLHTTRIYKENAAAWLGGARRALNEGGTSSSKTWLSSVQPTPSSITGGVPA